MLDHVHMFIDDKLKLVDGYKLYITAIPSAGRSPKLSIDVVESKTGLDFLSRLRSEIQVTVEGQKASRLWNARNND